MGQGGWDSLCVGLVVGQVAKQRVDDSLAAGQCSGRFRSQLVDERPAETDHIADQGQRIPAGIKPGSTGRGAEHFERVAAQREKIEAVRNGQRPKAGVGGQFSPPTDGVQRPSKGDKRLHITPGANGQERDAHRRREMSLLGE